MTAHLVTFSDESMSRAMDLCDQSARVSGIRHAHRYAPAHVEDLLFRNGIDRLARGCGYWAWKPAIILETMNRLGLVDTAFNLPGNNYIVYSDAGVEFINNVSHIIDRMADDVFLFGNSWQHLHWCKADAINAIVPEIPRDQFNKQCQASVIFFRVSEWSRSFVKEWLDWCLSPGLIDDSPSVVANHEEFREHRHDQALLTCLAYKYDIPLHWWPAVYNRFTGPEFTYEKGEYVDTYPPLFHHHRLRNHEIQTSHVLA